MVIDLNTYNQIIKLGMVQEQVSFFYSWTIEESKGNYK